MIGVENGKAERVGKFLLRDRQIESTVGDESGGGQPYHEFAEKVRYPSLCWPLSQANDPFPQDRLVDERGPPEGTGDGRMVVGQIHDRLARNIDNGERRECHDAVVHTSKDRDMQIAEVPWNEKGHDLTLTGRQQLVAAGEAFHHQAHTTWPLPLSDQMLLSGDLSPLLRRPFQNAAVVVREIGAVFELLDKRIGHAAFFREERPARQLSVP